MTVVSKPDLVRTMAEKTKATQKETAQFIDAFLQAVEENLAKGQKVQLIGFGTFEAKHAPSRKGRNPGTGEEILIPAKVNPVFKAGASLKNSVNS